MNDYTYSNQISSTDFTEITSYSSSTFSNTEVQPFLKWAGGKRKLLPAILSQAPKTFKRYLEPFVGGGAVAFLAKFNVKMLLNDANPELINTYFVVQNNLGELLGLLDKHQQEHSDVYYYQVRKQNPEDLNEIERAARFIYLNKTCFNGLYRVNKQGLFNVPIGRYKNPNLFNETNMHLASTVLKRAELFSEDYEKFLVEHAQEGDFIYLDPPYVPVGQHSDFKRYTKEQFVEKDQYNLARIFETLIQKGAYPVLSNSYSDLTLKLYSKYNIKVVKANRNINKDSKGRGFVEEIIVTPKH